MSTHHSSEAEVSLAAVQLDAVLDQGARLYHRCLGNAAAPLVKAALGFGQPPEKQCRIACLLEESTLPQESADTIDFPVLVSKDLIKNVREHYAGAFAAQQAALAGLETKSHGQCCHSPDSLTELPHITRTTLLHKPPTFVAVSWLCNPQLECFICFRRVWLRDTVCGKGEEVSPAERLHHFLKEVVLLDLLISVAPKLKCLWEYRLWVITQMVNGRLKAQLTCGDASAGLSASRFQCQDDVAFFTAAHHHPMNYNAWHYRRCVCRFCYLPNSLLGGASSNAQSIISYDAAAVLSFVRQHNGDSSATAYLLFLLEVQEKRDYLRTLRSSPPVGDSSPSRALETDSAACLWKVFMLCTQEEIRRHCDKGHDSMWYLRLELVRWACSRPSAAALCSSWSVEDELRWVAAYVDAISADANDELLSPVSALPHAWVESFGSAAWTSYNACRYGLQLLSILGYPTQPSAAK